MSKDLKELMGKGIDMVLFKGKKLEDKYDNKRI